MESPLEEVKLQPVEAKLSLAAVAVAAAAAAAIAAAVVYVAAAVAAFVAAVTASVAAAAAAGSCKDSYLPLALADPLDPLLVAALD